MLGAGATMKRMTATMLIAALSFAGGCSAWPAPTGTRSAASSTSPLPSAAARTASPVPDPWAHLFRPLHLPSPAGGKRCSPTSSSRELAKIGPILGAGPIYPAFLGTSGRFGVGFDDPSIEPVMVSGQQWWGKKTLWLSDDRYKDIALIRGGRIDATGDVLFYPGSGSDYVSALRLTRKAWVYGGSPAGWREWNSGVLFGAPGCYAFQIDGQDFTGTVVVEVLPHGSKLGA